MVCGWFKCKKLSSLVSLWNLLVKKVEEEEAFKKKNVQNSSAQFGPTLPLSKSVQSIISQSNLAASL